MPAVEDWMNKPLEIVNSIFDKYGLLACHEKVKEYFAHKVKTKAARNKIPSLNDTPLHFLECNSLVRFRCMIQDMFDPEFFMGAYEVVEKKGSQQRKLCCGLYKDVTEQKNTQEVDYESSRNVTLDRQTFYCVSLPGENKWVQKLYLKESNQPDFSLNINTSPRSKRSFEDDEYQSFSNNNDMRIDDASEMEDTCSDNKRSRHTMSHENAQECQSGAPQESNASINLNFPLPNMEGRACIIKVYESNDNLKLNEMVEFVGILSMDPSLAHTERKENDPDVISSGDIEIMGEEELVAHNPPASLVPRLHAILIYPVDHNNPYLPLNLKSLDCQSVLSELSMQASSVREEFMTFLTHILLGDALAAEFLLCHLISSVYLRRDVVALGKFCLNLFNIPLCAQYPRKIYDLIEQLTTKSFFLPLSLHNLNTWKFIPTKDYTANRLNSGVLQLSGHTHLVVDETALSVGLLESQGVKNLTALGNLIRWQKVEYDFNFHKLEYTANVPTLILSDGKSLLPTDCQIPLYSRMTEQEIESCFRSLDSYLTEPCLQRLRCYLTWLKLADYSLSKELQTAVQKDFVEIRKQDETFTQDDFHYLLVLARLLSLSFGETSLTVHCWERAKSLEKERKTCMKQRQGRRTETVDNNMHQ